MIQDKYGKILKRLDNSVEDEYQVISLKIKEKDVKKYVVYEIRIDNKTGVIGQYISKRYTGELQSYIPLKDIYKVEMDNSIWFSIADHWLRINKITLIGYAYKELEPLVYMCM